MTFMLFPEYAPHTIDVFKGLTDSGFYNSNTIFHRVISGFIIQGGDPLTNGLGGPVFRYNDEWNPQAIFSGNGQLALANSGKNTDGSQFFVTVAPYRSGDFSYTVFGQLLRGFNVLSNINNTATDTNSRPLANVIIARISFVPDTSDTALTLTTTNLSGVTGTIQIIADDGAGGRTTNTFTATTLTDTNDNGQPFIYRNTVTNLVARINLPLTNVLNATALNGEALYWFPLYQDQASINAVSNLTSSFTNSTLETLTYNITNALGQLTLIVKPQTNYAGPVNMAMVVSANPNWYNYYRFGYTFPYAVEDYTFAFGDTPISAQSTNFTALELTPFANQPLAWFTNGVPTSPLTNFTSYINWGDNVTNSGVIIKNANGSDEVLGSHMYTNAGTYPIYLTIQSYLGAASTVVSTASVPPTVSLTLAGTNNILTWPAWATEYQLQSATSLSGSSWQATSNFPALNGYTSVVTNGVTNPALFFRLAK
jgi:cyclophilin family peptidyl-prolyl cis-trans isomerase